MIMCPICLDVFIEPITLMCKHELCKECYETHFQKADFRCPMCQKRLSSWARKAASNGSLVNVTKWKFIQENFSEMIQNRLKGSDNYEVFQPDPVRLAEDGEIHKEYVKAKLEWETEKKAETDQEESASLELIQKLLQEDKEELERIKLEQIKQDQELAQVVSSQLNQPISPNTVGKKLLRSTTAVKKKKPPATSNPITKYCVKRSRMEKENSSPDSDCEDQSNLSKVLSQSSKRIKLSTL